MSATEQARAVLEQRLAELQPYLEEAEEIRSMLATLDSQPRVRRRRVPLAERREWMLTRVRKDPGVRVTDLAAELGLSVPRVVQIVNQLEADGDVRRTGDGIAPAR